jgi:hypothetical protein
VDSDPGEGWKDKKVKTSFIYFIPARLNHDISQAKEKCVSNVVVNNGNPAENGGFSSLKYIISMQFLFVLLGRPIY